MFFHKLQGDLEDSCSSRHSLPLIQGTLEMDNYPASLFEEEKSPCFLFTRIMHLSPRV